MKFFNRRRAFRLEPRGPIGDKLVGRLVIGVGGETNAVLLPCAARLRYFVVPDLTIGNLSIASDDFTAEPLGMAASLAARVRARLFIKRPKILDFARFRIFAGGPKPARKVFTAATRRLKRSGAALDGPVFAKYPELLSGWTRQTLGPAIEKRPQGSLCAVAIVVHIYYKDTWPEIAAILNRIKTDFDLLVTTVPGMEALADEIRCAFPRAEIFVFENRGRDVRPFLALLEQGRLDPYRAVCKIHGKKSHDGGRQAILGAIWRNRMLFDLLAAPDVVTLILRRFETDPTVGMIGPRAYRYPSALCSKKLSWGENRARVLELAERIGVAPERFILDFFCGTMFWVRPEALRPLRELHLESEFPDEMGKLDGALEHAVERIFSTAATQSGYAVEGIDGCSGQFSSEPLRRGSR